MGKLFAVLPLAVTSRQVNKFGDTAIGAECTDAATDCGDNTECKAPEAGLIRAGEVCTCLENYEQDGDSNNCKEIVDDGPKNLGDPCADKTECGTEAACGPLPAIRADGDVCICPDEFEPNEDGINCDAKTTVPDTPAHGAECTTEVGCGDKQECVATDGDDTNLTCQCIADHDYDETAGECKSTIVDDPPGDSAALYSVATAFMA